MSNKVIKIGLYCNWSVKATQDGFYILSPLKKYLDAFAKKTDSPLILTSNTSSAPIEKHEVFVPYGQVQLIPINGVTNYASSILHFGRILTALKELSRRSSYIYIKTFEPFSWVLGLYKKNNQILNYHIVANPYEFIWNDRHTKFHKKLLKSVLFFPDYILICFAAFLNKATCNGSSVLRNIPFFLRKVIHVTIESSLTKEEYRDKNSVSVCDQGEIKILSIGALQNTKGVDCIIRGVHLLKNKRPELKVKLSILGDGPEMAFLKDLALNLGMTKDIVFHGNVGVSEVFQAYDSHNVFVMPSLSETGPRVILEAMARRIFCLSTDVGYVKDVIAVDGVPQCFMINKNSSEDICEGIGWYIDNRDGKVKEMIHKAYLSSEKYSLDNFVDDILLNGRS